MADGSTAIELSLSELREVTGYAVACARPALAVFERERPDDRRPRSALDVAQAFADGARRTKALRDHAWAAHRAAQETRDAGQAAASDAARCRPRVRCGVPPSPGQSHPGQAHPRLSGPRRTRARTGRRRRSHRRSRPPRTVAAPREPGRGGRPEALPGRPARRRTGRSTDPPVGHVAPVHYDALI